MFVPQPIAEEHDLTAFNSGEDDMDDWLREHAFTTSTRGLSRTFVWVNEGKFRVVAYYTLSAHQLEREQFSKKLGRGLPSAIPAILLGRLALDRSLHGAGWGGALLAEATSRVVAASEQVGSRYLVVDALHTKAAEFYEHYGFTRIPDQESLRLIWRMDRAFSSTQ